MPNIPTVAEQPLPQPHFLERLKNRIAAEGPLEAFSWGTVALAGLATVVTGEQWPMFAAAQGLGVTIANNTNNSVGVHRQVEGHSVKLSKAANMVSRFTQACLTGLRLERSVPVHVLHHRHADTEKDPHRASNLRFYNLGRKVSNAAAKLPDDLVEQARTDRRTRRMLFDRPAFTAAASTMLHTWIGSKLGLPPEGIAAALGIHMTGAYAQIYTFMKSSHGPDGPRDLRHSPLAQLVGGGESWHGEHHRKRRKLRGAKYDLGALAVYGLEKIGQAKVMERQYPYKDSEAA